MTDHLMTVPIQADDTGGCRSLRHGLRLLCDETDERLDRLHRSEALSDVDAATGASTQIRELRAATVNLLDSDIDDEELLTTVFATFSSLSERVDELTNGAELRQALRDEPGALEDVERHALVIGDFAGAGLIGYVTNEVPDPARFTQVDDSAHVPLLHALMRSITTGLRSAPTGEVRVQDIVAEMDGLAGKVLEQFAPIPHHGPHRDKRMAMLAGTVLWNLVRRARRDAMSQQERDESLAARQQALEPVQAAVRYQARRLPTMPDFPFWYDIGLGFGLFEPVLRELAAGQDLAAPTRADAVLWWTITGDALRVGD